MKINRKNPILQYISEEEKKYKELFRVTEKFHSTMDINSVLSKIIHSLKQTYPQYEYTLLLSDDHDASEDLPIKDLEYNSGNAAALAAYVNSTLEFVEDEYPVMYAPLKGKQGVYGVLQVTSHLTSPIRNSQIEFIRLLAYTAGGALENAKLYQQSQKLIEDLRLLNETSHKLDSTTSLNETIEFLHTQIIKSIHSSANGFILLGKNGPEVLQGSSSFFTETTGQNLIKTLVIKIKQEKEALFIGDVRKNEDIKCSQYGALMAVPIIHNDSLKGIAVAVGDEAYSFTFEMFKLFQSLIHRSALAVTNSMLRERLERMVITDQLTELSARNYLNKTIEESMKCDSGGIFILIDLDDFKSINDTYGHQVGDEVLIQVARIIQGSLNESQIGARWGGEELAIYLPNTSLDCGAKLANHLLDQVSKGTNPSITISCGISNWGIGYFDEVKQLFNRADAALYEAKNAGKNRIVINSIIELA